MRLIEKSKDGGPASPVDAFFLFEIKSLFSIALLRFNMGGREAYHTHAFNALNWFISGELIEQDVSGKSYNYRRSIWPKITRRDKNHRVFAYRTSWCLTIRGPWKNTWTEYDAGTDTTTTLTNGRYVITTKVGV